MAQCKNCKHLKRDLWECPLVDCNADRSDSYCRCFEEFDYDRGDNANIGFVTPNTLLEKLIETQGVQLETLLRIEKTLDRIDEHLSNRRS